MLTIHLPASRTNPSTLQDKSSSAVILHVESAIGALPRSSNANPWIHKPAGRKRGVQLPSVLLFTLCLPISTVSQPFDDDIARQHRRLSIDVRECQHISDSGSWPEREVLSHQHEDTIVLSFNSTAMANSKDSDRIFCPRAGHHCRRSCAVRYRSAGSIPHPIMAGGCGSWMEQQPKRIDLRRGQL